MTTTHTNIDPKDLKANHKRARAGLPPVKSKKDDDSNKSTNE